MNYIDYIKEHKDDITATCRKVTYKDIYKKSFDDIDNVIFQKVLCEFKEDALITRNDIFERIDKNNLTESFLRIILWGGLNPANINRVMCDFDGAETKLKNTFNLINGNASDNIQRDISKAFREMSFGGNNHISGISTSFFTKLLYFFDQSKECLIYDRWGRLQHCALIASINDPNDPVKKYYTLINDNDKIVPSIAKGKSDWDLYCDYMIRMQSIAKDINVGVDKLEEFLFGYYQRKYDKENPRRFLHEILLPLCEVTNKDSMTMNNICQRDEWSPFCKLKSLKRTTHTKSYSSLIKGYCVPINNEEFRVFVAKRVKPNRNGLIYYCNLMYKLGRETNFCFTNYPRVNEIVRDFFDYNNNGRTKYAYWFRYLNSEKEAINFLEEVYEIIYLYCNE